jgi:hypothetical protein
MSALELRIVLLQVTLRLLMFLVGTLACVKLKRFFLISFYNGKTVYIFSHRIIVDIMGLMKWLLLFKQYTLPCFGFCFLYVLVLFLAFA